MCEAQLITDDLRDDPEYNQIERQFSSLLECFNTVKEFEEHCKKFIRALRNSSGPLEIVAKKLSDKWKEKVKSELSIDLVI